MQTFVERGCRAELRPYVRRLILTDSHGSERARAAIAPTGYAYLGWVVEGEMLATVDGQAHARFRAGELFVGGALSGEDVIIDYTARYAQILVEFTVTGLFELLGVEGAAIAGIALPLEALGGNRLEPLRQTVETTEAGGTLQTHADALQTSLVELVDHTRHSPAAIAQAAEILERADGRCRIANVAAEVGLSTSQLRRQFRRAAGMAPKTFARVLMFNKAMEHLIGRGAGELADLALEAGYYDQAHFINAVQRVVGRSPARYLCGPAAFPSELYRRQPSIGS